MRLWSLSLALILPIILSGGAQALAQPVSEYAVKAAFVFDFSKFVTWPPRVFQNASSPVRICVLGENPFGSALEQMAAGKSFKRRSFEVINARDVQAVRNCQIVFIARSERKNLSQILNAIGRTGVLTVADTDEFARRGVMINLFLQGNRVHFAINPKAAAHAGITISSQLLSLAKIVTD